MKAEILLALLGLVAAAAGVWFLRHSQSEGDVQSATPLLGWVFCFVAVMLIGIAVAGMAAP